MSIHIGKPVGAAQPRLQHNLEIQPGFELESSISDLAGEIAKRDPTLQVQVGGTRGGSKESSRQTRCRMVENIGRVKPERDTLALRHLNPLLDGHVGRPEANALD